MTASRRTAPYGAWESPIAPAVLAADTVRLGGIALDGEHALWVEGRPRESGRSALVAAGRDAAPRERLAAPWSVRSRVHEYGGGAFAAAGGTVWFVHDADQRLYVARPGAAPVPLTPEGALRFADPAPSPDGARVACVCEDHGAAGEPENTLVAVDAAGGGVTVLARGHDFYACPRWRADGRALAFLAWDHPDMPWDATTLYLAVVGADGMPEPARAVAGGRGESVFQPQWAPDGKLWFVSDAPGFWNLHRLEPQGPRCVLREAAEYGMPMWQLGMSSYGFAGAGTLVAASCREGRWHVDAIDLRDLRRTPMPLPVSAVSALVAGPGQALMVAASPRRSASVLRWRLADAKVEVLRESAPLELAAEGISQPEAITFPSAGGAHAHGFFYPPLNPGFEAPAGERPPLLVVGHGGPTGATAAALDPGIQFWTSRGFAVLDVNYRGSTGYGRAYRRLLEGAWGIADVEDCVHGARHLAAAGRVDGARLAIRGRSAGGYTVLAALTFHDAFSAGASYYGIGDLEALARDTHKFESRYLDWLVGPYPQCAQRYRERSPIHHVQRLSCPVIFFQGLEDAVVPPNQAEAMRDALRAKGIPVACLLFEGEQHGFRRAATIVRALEAELSFYGRVFGFEPAGSIEPVAIENL